MDEKIFVINQKVLVIVEEYPFFLVGTIDALGQDTISIKAEFGVPLPLKGHVFTIKKDSLAAFFVETENHKIPAVW